MGTKKLRIRFIDFVPIRDIRNVNVCGYYGIAGKIRRSQHSIQIVECLEHLFGSIAAYHATCDRIYGQLSRNVEQPACSAARSQLCVLKNDAIFHNLPVSLPVSQTLACFSHLCQLFIQIPVQSKGLFSDGIGNIDFA